MHHGTEMKASHFGIKPKCERSWSQENKMSGNSILWAETYTRDSKYAIARICHRNFRPSVHLSVSVTWVDQSKTVEVWIMQFSLYSSPVPLIFAG